ncbi:MAG: hypothetical protein SV760_03630 [Halobacteria archaeon]|nr:hypothetical protein [Halobacteria archaeon]
MRLHRRNFLKSTALVTLAGCLGGNTEAKKSALQSYKQAMRSYKSAQQKLSEAQNAYESGNYSEASDLYSQAADNYSAAQKKFFEAGNKDIPSTPRRTARQAGKYSVDMSRAASNYATAADLRSEGSVEAAERKIQTAKGYVQDAKKHQKPVSVDEFRNQLGL